MFIEPILKSVYCSGAGHRKTIVSVLPLQTSPFYTLLGTKWALIWAPHGFHRKDPFVFVHVGPKWAVFVGSPDLDCNYSM